MTFAKTDEDFDYFIKNFGEPEISQKIPNEVFNIYRNKLPIQLLKYWEIVGESAYFNKLFWIANPEKYQLPL